RRVDRAVLQPLRALGRGPGGGRGGRANRAGGRELCHQDRPRAGGAGRLGTDAAENAVAAGGPAQCARAGARLDRHHFRQRAPPRRPPMTALDLPRLLPEWANVLTLSLLSTAFAIILTTP